MPNIIKQLRTELGLTRTEFGKALGVVRTTVMRWEEGKVEPSEAVILAVRHLAQQYKKTRSA